MTVLGIETATTVCGAAVVRDGEVLAAREEVQRHIHAERLLPLTAAVLAEAGCGLDGLGGIAVSIGPGSFTGLRIGLSAAKGLAYARGIPVAGVPTLDMLALRAARIAAPGSWILPVLDARHGEVYCRLFRTEAHTPVPEEEVRDERTADLPARLRMRPLVLTGEGAETLAAAWPAAGRDGVTVLPEPHRRCDAALVALAGAAAIAAGRADDLAALEPRYVKDFFLKVR